MHKKFFAAVLIAITLGSLLGHTLFKKYQQEEQVVFKERNVVYFLQEGVYDNQERAEKATENLDTKLIVKEDAKYYVYLAITKNTNNLRRLEKMYKDMKLEVHVKQMNVSNSSFLTALEQMDGLMSTTKENEEMQTINKVVLATYQETILKQ